MKTWEVIDHTFKFRVGDSDEKGGCTFIGGSWKDVAHFLKVSTRDYEKKDKKRSYIGFRTVQSYLGEDVGFQENPNKIF